MARLNRLAIAGHPHLLLQQARPDAFVLRDEEDAMALTEALMVSVAQVPMALHGYVLLPDRWMLLATPDAGEAVSQVMQSVGRRYVRHVNRRYGMRGGLWASRFSSTVLDGPQWMLPCLTYMDTAPVRLGLAQISATYRYGSHRHYTGMQHDRQLVVPPEVWRLGNTPFAREAAYAEMVREGLTVAQVHEIEHALQHGWALGQSAFVDQLQLLTDRRLRPRPRGRPPRSGIGSP
ncbi:MAG: transposase [Burkholderiaceae bacterium]